MRNAWRRYGGWLQMWNEPRDLQQPVIIDSGDSWVWTALWIIGTAVAAILFLAAGGLK
jgi:hypothetical protein